MLIITLFAISAVIYLHSSFQYRYYHDFLLNFILLVRIMIVVMLVLIFVFGVFLYICQFIEILWYLKLRRFHFYHFCLFRDFLCIIIFITAAISKIITPVKLIKYIFIERFSSRNVHNHCLFAHWYYQMGIIPNFVRIDFAFLLLWEPFHQAGILEWLVTATYLIWSVWDVIFHLIWWIVWILEFGFNCLLTLIMFLICFGEEQITVLFLIVKLLKHLFQFLSINFIL